MCLKSCLITGCDMTARKKATVAQELLSEETLQQLLKQEELWQQQEGKNIKKLTFWTNLVVAVTTGRQPNSSKLMATRSLLPDFRRVRIRSCCSACCAPPAFPTVFRANCRLTRSSHNGETRWRLHVLPQLFITSCNLKTLPLNSCKIAAS